MSKQRKRLLLSNNTCLQLVKFGLVGISNTILSLVIYYSIIYMGINYLIANTIAFVVSVLNAYFWNNKYVFVNNVYWIKGLLKTYASYGVSFLLSIFLLWLFVEIINISKIAAPVLVLSITTPFNFIMNKYWTFRR